MTHDNIQKVSAAPCLREDSGLCPYRGGPTPPDRDGPPSFRLELVTFAAMMIVRFEKF
jgi:hypothetical protein